MAQLGRPGISIGQKGQIWKLWRKGKSLSDISRAVGKKPGSVFGVLKLHGGITPYERRRSNLSLSLEEREEISRGIVAGFSIRQISREIGRAASTVSREISRNGGRHRYRAAKADETAWLKAKRPKPCLLASLEPLRKIVVEKLSLDWSPEQISGWLKRAFPHDNSMRISHETIYRSLFIQSRGVLRKVLIKHLRTGRVMRQSKKNNTKGSIRGQIIDGVSIRERPSAIEDRSIPGHWEGDLIAGTKNTHIATLVERQSRYTVLVQVEGKDTSSVIAALSRQLKEFPEILRRSLTWDRGMELASHKQFSLATDMQVYFCDPKSPWQRGTNENTNGLVRQYLPKKTDLSLHSQKDLNDIALKLNTRPRKTLEFFTPHERFWESVALTV